MAPSILQVETAQVFIYPFDEIYAVSFGCQKFYAF